MPWLIIVFAVLAFLAIFVLLYNVCIRKYKSSEPKKLTQSPKEDKVTEEKKEEKLPEILEEITRGNYMQDIAYLDESDELEVNMVENKNIRAVKPEFKPIQLDGEMQDEALTTKDILDEMDNDVSNENNLQKEISSLSSTMKAMLIANLLEKKDKF